MPKVAKLFNLIKAALLKDRSPVYDEIKKLWYTMKKLLTLYSELLGTWEQMTFPPKVSQLHIVCLRKYEITFNKACSAQCALCRQVNKNKAKYVTTYQISRRLFSQSLDWRRMMRVNAGTKHGTKLLGPNVSIL